MAAWAQIYNPDQVIKSLGGNNISHSKCFRESFPIEYLVEL